MVARLTRFGVVVSAIDICSVPGMHRVEIDPVDDQNEPSAYPEGSPELDRVLQFDDGDSAKSRRFLIEVDRPLARDDVEQFEKWMQPWYGMLEAGAFSPPIGAPSEEDCLKGVVSHFSESMLEVSVDRFRASEQAWLVLGNMTIAWWRQYGRVLQLLVD